MTGRAVNLTVEKGPAKLGAAVLEVDGLTVRGAGRPAVDRVSFIVRAGEIVGIAGVAGNGQTELIEALTGLRAARRRPGGNRGARRHEDRCRASSPRRSRLHSRGSRGDRRGAAGLGGGQSGDGLPSRARRSLVAGSSTIALSRRMRDASSPALMFGSAAKPSRSARCQAATCRSLSSRGSSRMRARC